MTHHFTRDELVARLVRAGELEVAGASQEEIDSYFDTENFAFHGPDGFDTDYAGLTDFFRSLRSAFDDRSIRRGIVIAEGDQIACQTWIEGTFVRPFTHSPAGRLEPTGARVVMDLINIFRFDDRGRLVEEFVRTDNRNFLRQLGVAAA
ncbi:ester cyclase [Jiangella alkaliphila]|uniref:Predicted ester cyclase n=1 Tax=Jiangella alkaliphila TaxID=419479 RepID=A0A1H2IT18_9ACTN|nr:ester cyclase [Jiangella alkaliphila]SDU47253.1 Predicted ester cyclase [Jiangella alkaliphila]